MKTTSVHEFLTTSIKLEPYRFNRDEYYRMPKADIIDENEKAELIDGVIYKMFYRTPLHAGTGDRLNHHFILRIKAPLQVRVLGVLQPDEYNDLRPDFMLLNWRKDDYCSRHPYCSEVPFIIELADKSLEFDCIVKAEMYAAAGIVEYWVADLIHDQMIVHRNPNPATKEYSDVQRYGKGMKIAPLCAPECELDLTWLFS